MADVHVRVFDASVVGVGDHDDLLRDFGELTAATADQRNGAQAVLVCPSERLDDVR